MTRKQRRQAIRQAWAAIEGKGRLGTLGRDLLREEIRRHPDRDLVGDVGRAPVQDLILAARLLCMDKNYFTYFEGA